jgi:hypothetical protein
MRIREKEPAQGEKLAFETHEYRGYKIKALYLNDGSQDARIEIWTITSIVRAFRYPAYKIWNISAHAEDVIEGYIEENAEPTVAPSQPRMTIRYSCALCNELLDDCKCVAPSQLQPKGDIK